MEHHTPKSAAPEATSERLGAHNGDAQSPMDAFRDAGEKLVELKSYVSYYVAAKADQLKTTVRNLVLYAGLGVVGLFIAATAIIMGVAIFCLGFAYTLTAAFGGRAWAGFLVAGSVIVALIAAGAFVGYLMVTRSARKRMVEKYEQLQHQQRLEFGNDVCLRAEEAGRD